MGTKTNKDFCHLHLHSEYSALDGFGSPETYAKKAASLGFDSIGITDHGNIDGSIKFQRACLANGVKPIIGCELYIDADRHTRGKDSKRNHINAYVKNETGWQNLLRMITIANLEGFSRKPRIDPETLLNNCEGLCFGTACLGGFIRNEWGLKLLQTLSKKCPGDIYLEIMPHDWPGQKEWNKNCVKLSKKYGVKMIATNDCHYPDKENAISQEILLAIQMSTDWDNPKRYRFQANTLYFCGRKEMVKLFKKNHDYIVKKIYEKALDNTMEIANKCNKFRIERCEIHLPLIPQVKKNKENKFFADLIAEGFKSKLKKKYIKKARKTEYEARIKEELYLLTSKGFARYFLIVWELVNWCEEQGIMIGPGRGSVGGCLIAWLIGITEVDPLKYDLVFSRFISPERKDLPDIDLDFDANRRQEVIEHFRQLYGKDNVIQISTFLKMKGKMSLQDVGRTFGIERSKINKINKLFDEDEELTIDSFKKSEIKEIRDFYKENKKVVEHALVLQGCIRGYGKHAAGICISSKKLTTGAQCSLAKRNGVITANWDKDDCEYMGLMKLDILGLSALTRIDECVKLIKENHNETINLKALKFNDKKVFRQLSTGDTTGVFQLGTWGISKFCKELKIDSFKDIYDITSLYRPGTLRSGMAKEFVARKHGKPWKCIHKNVKELTKDTYGIIVYQEQVMMMAKNLAGFSWEGCGKMRKVIAKSKGAVEFNKFRDDFINGCIKKDTLNKTQATQLFDDIVSFSSYGFNKSHAVEYSTISYWDAWLKYYYPAEFYASSLSFSSLERKKEILKAVVKQGLKVWLPKIGLSKAIRWRAKGNKLIMPFVEIFGVGESAAAKICDQNQKKRNGFFKSAANFNIPGTSKNALRDIRAYDIDYKPKYNDLKAIKEYFQYNLYEILGF